MLVELCGWEIEEMGVRYSGTIVPTEKWGRVEVGGGSQMRVFGGRFFCERNWKIVLNKEMQL